MQRERPAPRGNWRLCFHGSAARDRRCPWPGRAVGLAERETSGTTGELVRWHSESIWETHRSRKQRDGASSGRERAWSGLAGAGPRNKSTRRG